MQSNRSRLERGRPKQVRACSLKLADQSFQAKVGLCPLLLLAMPFKPVAVSSLENAEEEITFNGRPPAPPQSTRRIARQRPSASRMDESPPSPPAVPITSTTTSQPRRGAASSAVQSDVTKTNKGKLAVKPANGNTVASASAEQSDSEGLGAKGSIETEVAAQRKEWEDEADRIRSTAGHSVGVLYCTLSITVSATPPLTSTVVGSYVDRSSIQSI